MSNNTSRRASILRSGAAATLVALAAAGCSGGDSGDAEASGLKRVVIAQPVPPSVIQWPTYVADQLGYFADEGLDAQLAPASDDVSMAAFVTNGTADVSIAGASEVLFAAREGSDVKVIFDWWTKSAEGVMVPADSDVSAPEQLRGRTVGVGTDEDRAFLSTALGAAGLSIDDVNSVVIGGGGAVVANAFRSGDIDAFSGAVSDFAALEAAGVGLRDITPDTLAATPASSFLVTTEKLRDDRETLVGVLRSYAKGTYAGLVNPEALAAMSAQEVPEEWRDEAAGTALMDVVLSNATPDDDARIGDVRAQVWSQAQEQLIAAGELETAQDLDAILTQELIEEANDWDRAEVEADMAAWMQENS